MVHGFNSWLKITSVDVEERSIEFIQAGKVMKDQKMSRASGTWQPVPKGLTFVSLKCRGRLTQKKPLFIVFSNVQV